MGGREKGIKYPHIPGHVQLQVRHGLGLEHAPLELRGEVELRLCLLRLDLAHEEVFVADERLAVDGVRLLDHAQAAALAPRKGGAVGYKRGER